MTKLLIVLAINASPLTALGLSSLPRASAAVQSATKSDPPEAGALVQQIVALYNDGKFDDALPLAKRLLEVREQALGSDDPLVATALVNLGRLYQAKKDYYDAEGRFKRALAIQQKAYGAESMKLCPVLEDLGWMYHVNRSSGEAEASFQRAISIREKALGPEDLQVARSLFTLGRFYQKSGNSSKAVEAYKRALAIEEKTVAPNSKELGELLEKCACALLPDHQDEAHLMQARASAILHPGVHTVHGPVLQGRAIRRVEPRYPEEARRERISGTTIIVVTVDATGRVIEARPVCGPDLLVGAALAAARDWRFTPTQVGGQPVKVIGTITFTFKL